VTHHGSFYQERLPPLLASVNWIACESHLTGMSDQLGSRCIGHSSGVMAYAFPWACRESSWSTAEACLLLLLERSCCPAGPDIGEVALDRSCRCYPRKLNRATSYQTIFLTRERGWNGT